MRHGAALLLAVLVVCGAGAASAERAKPAAFGLGVGYRPPEFESKDLGGTAQSIEKYRGSVLVLHFWATWCPYCRNEIPELTELQTQWADKGVRVLAVSTDQDARKLEQFLAKSPVPYPVVHDPAIAGQYAVSGIPVTYVVGRDGRIVQRLEGASDIISTVERALAEPAA
jgi:peroxiredoxin